MPFVDFFRNSRASLQIFSKGEMQTSDIETFPVPFFFKLFLLLFSRADDFTRMTLSVHL